MLESPQQIRTYAMKKLFALFMLTGLFITACQSEEFRYYPTEEEPIVEETGIEEDIPEEPDVEEPTDDRQNFVEESDVEFNDVKPVIYLYPEEESAVSVQLDYLGKITTEYPASEEGVWNVVAQPDGTLTYKDRTYNYLFWEGISPLYQNFTFKDGFVVAEADYVNFLEEKLALLGLSEVEQADFITYWLPQMQRYPYMEVRFLFEEYERLATLTVTPTPDTMIRVFAMMKGLNQPVALPEQNLPAKIRQGFTVVEWGGRFIQK